MTRWYILNGEEIVPSDIIELTRNRYTFILEVDFEPYLYKVKIRQL